MKTRVAAVLLLCALSCRQVAGTEPSLRGSPAEVPTPPASAERPAEVSSQPQPSTPPTAEPTATTSSGPNTAPLPSAAAPAGQVYVVAAVGDSLTDYRSPLGGGYLRTLERHCPRSRFDNFGKGGSMVNQMRRRFRDQVLAEDSPRYTHVIVFGGINDLYSDLTANRTNDKIEADLGQMYAWAHEAGAKVVAISVTPWGGFRKYWNVRRQANTLALNSWMQQQLGGTVAHYVDAHQLLACDTRLCQEYADPFKDGIHFGKQGHALLGEALHTQVFPDCL